jgi:hypothetical protein
MAHCFWARVNALSVFPCIKGLSADPDVGWSERDTCNGVGECQIDRAKNCHFDRVLGSIDDRPLTNSNFRMLAPWINRFGARHYSYKIPFLAKDAMRRVVANDSYDIVQPSRWFAYAGNGFFRLACHPPDDGARMSNKAHEQARQCSRIDGTLAGKMRSRA